MIRSLTFLLITVAPVAAQATAPISSSAVAAAHERLWLGSAWYPEQWPESRWDADLALMEKAGANVVRVGEFAWARMEPSEGHYDLDWLERAIRAAERHHIKVVIGTPTDTPPNWMTTKYPEVMKIASDGTPSGLGGRRQFSISSPLYHDFCRKIVTELAKRFGHDPDVIGWQVGNEFTDESYDPAAKVAWHAWLQKKYSTLDRLNDAWTTAYWSQTYFAWDQVPFNDKPGNPGWVMDEKRFITDQWAAFQKNQLGALRSTIDNRQFVTTNLGGLGWADKFDRYAINRDLDLASWDDYVGTGHLEPYRNGATHDLVRGWKRRNFWVMEAQPGFVNWSPNNNILARGETRAMAWQAVGHGADAILYWQWRSALNGQEQYHGAVVGPDGTPLPFYDEFAEVGRDFAKASPALAGTAPVSQAAILQDYPSRWAIDSQPHTKAYDQIEVLLDTYRPLKDALGAVDIVQASDDLDRYKLVFAPSLNVIPQALADRLAAYVRSGGHLVIGPRAGMKDEFNRLTIQRQPGPLVDTLGGRVEQFYALDDKDHVEVSGGGSNGTAKVWAEMLSVKAPGATVPLRYGKANGWLDGKPAAITRTYGEGSITYLGALLDPALMTKFVDSELAAAKVLPGLTVPNGVEAMTREGAGKRITILINHGAAPQHVALPAPMADVLDGGMKTDVPLAPQGVAVLEQQGRP
jgi:beta-galactosidase